MTKIETFKKLLKDIENRPAVKPALYLSPKQYDYLMKLSNINYEKEKNETLIKSYLGL